MSLLDKFELFKAKTWPKGIKRLTIGKSGYSTFGVDVASELGLGKDYKSVSLCCGGKEMKNKEEPFVIKVGEWYETCDHQKAQCFDVVDNEVYFFTIDYHTCFTTNTKGINWKEQGTNDLDIIGPWEETND